MSVKTNSVQNLELFKYFNTAFPRVFLLPFYSQCSIYYNKCVFFNVIKEKLLEKISL